jgi:hypothetical protein
MDTHPTNDKTHTVKASRPGWKALLVFAVFIGGLVSFLNYVKI